MKLQRERNGRWEAFQDWILLEDFLFLSFCQCHFILLEVFRQDGATVVRELSDAYVLVFAVHL